MTYPQDWDTAQQKLTSLFPDKTVRGKILGRLLSKEVKNRLEYFRDEDEVVKASLEVLLPEESSANSQLVAMLDDIRRQQDVMQAQAEEHSRQQDADIMEIRMQSNRRPQTSHDECDIGKAWYAKAPVAIPSFLKAQDDQLLEAASEAIAAAFPLVQEPGARYTGPLSSKRSRSAGSEVDALPSKPPRPGQERQLGLTLADVAQVGKADFDEENYMQPAVMTVLQAAKAAVGPGGPVIVDTHSEGLRGAPAKPDACSLHTDLRVWSQVVVLWEFKLSNATKSYDRMVGQQITRVRHVMDQQPLRTLVVAVCLTMETFELLWVERKAHSSISVSRSGQELLSFCAQSRGFTLLLRLLATPEVDLGFRLPPEPHMNQLGQYAIRKLKLLAYGTAPSGHGSHVYQVSAERTAADAAAAGSQSVQSTDVQLPADAWHGPAILKLHNSEKEGVLLAKLLEKSVPHVITLLADGSCDYAGKMWCAILVAPVVKQLSLKDDLKLFAQVIADIATAIKESAAAGVAHRDVTPNNFGHIDGRGLLYDYSAGKAMTKADWGKRPSDEGAPNCITGTMSFSARSVLGGGAHTVSSMLEGLYLSVLDISTDGYSSRHSPSSVSEAKMLRSKQLEQQLEFEHAIAEHVKPLVLILRDLFFQPTSVTLRLYNEEVTAEDVHERCMSIIPDIKLD